MKPIKKIVIYYEDGTYQEVEASKPPAEVTLKYPPGVRSPTVPIVPYGAPCSKCGASNQLPGGVCAIPDCPTGRGWPPVNTDYVVD